DDSTMTRAELKEVLRLHETWLRSGGKDGKHADLRNADLRHADLREAQLSRALLSSIDLSGANLRGANLMGANLHQGYLSGARITKGNLSDCDLTAANLSGVNLWRTVLANADLAASDLREANLVLADLSGTSLIGADLSGADLFDVNLTDARVYNADFAGAYFEPKAHSLPYIPSVASAQNLSELRFKESEAGLVELRTALKDAGLRDREREVNYAIHRIRREARMREGYILDVAFQFVLFEITCQYGMAPWRPVKIMGFLIIVFMVPYLAVILRKRRSSRSDIWVGIEDESIRSNRQRKRRFRVLSNTRPARTWRARLRLIRRAVSLALYFSALTTFRVGFREINVGNWVTRMQCREYTLRSTGWVRFVSGVQSLISVCLLALWLLTYFGRPFE
ncbi:MAG: pentapeptide repeat-containing protein, partial [Phycisphaerae bacterium]